MSERNAGFTVIQDTCCSSGTKALIACCSGASNVGQAANSAMIELDKQGIGNAFCLAGVGAALSGFIESAKSGKMLVIDGCPTGCARKTLEKYGITPTHYFVVTEMDIEKNHKFDSLDAETKKTVDYIKSNL